MKTWAVRVTVELLQDDVVVASRRQIQGANAEHVPFDRLYVIPLAAGVARRVARTAADDLHLLETGR